MPNERKKISSGDIIEEINCHFKVTAGPGAGKTYWLVNHIKNVLRKTKKLTPASKVACISYTTIASEEIKRKLGNAGDRVEVSTIHSFLYRNILKPYLWVIDKKDGNPLVNFERVDNHEDHFLAEGYFVEIMRERKLFYKINEAFLKESLLKLRWSMEAGQVSLGFPPTVRPQLNKWYSDTKEKIDDFFMAYKGKFWEKGIIHHDDVLYFSIRILMQLPFLSKILSKKFPYVFIDEFQDTNSIQTAIVKILAASGSFVGVIGDPAQAIYAFQNACVKDFEAFSLTGLNEFVIEDNWRSTNAIVSFLNSLRSDISQEGLRKVIGKPVVLFIGTHSAAMSAVRAELNSISGEEKELFCLARKNDFVGEIRGLGQGAGASGLWKRFDEADKDRFRFFRFVTEGLELSVQGRFESSVREVLKALRVKGKKLTNPFSKSPEVSEIGRRAMAVKILQYFLAKRCEFLPKTLFEVYSLFSSFLTSKYPEVGLSSYSKGGKKEFAESASFGDLVSSVLTLEETRKVRTIHQAKAAEFQSVIVCFQKPADLKQITSPDMTDEEHRIAYVAASRARDRLWFVIPACEEKDRSFLSGKNVEIIQL
jgi:DNA helicase-2/ATP-dependent DNA helicase PcrA